ncbi:non-hydrolyzing UDP-N-acetylglucosamine 2-epimerase [Belliella kenyensis]|uniref:Non-hydrolyzing UDP-N-acetylglucosamine 2-epimerase n=1 Tax=Belliella kenyensis TaxID=1472724 RepID=A0ABV8EMJ7_9BACT|nr:UDP-N-acetylglucosamine 2-epimerase (non-hydrolyzing) [Belliella kenyensis]MCH7401595.1 UDP-N-acetylglucosamine 2-epimerase (non-hydrolyzing) [Belliella kenyensis]MDN3603125.1 UDP-N-acetylglucosamine 2-epimerase (non-hydrolyzing) [Belliella kenyensis]
MALITLVAGARPNFMKIAPIIHQLLACKDSYPNLSYRLVHTGQHYDQKMSGDFFEQLHIPSPDINLGAGGGSQAEQTAAVMLAFEKELLAHRPDLVIVVGDVTSTLACTITAKKLLIDVAHVEGGIRSGDMTMPEEINRIVTDSITDHFFTTSKLASDNLSSYGVSEERIHFVGNTMIDTLITHRPRFTKPSGEVFERLEKGKYFVLTMHRPANVDQQEKLKAMIEAIINGTEGLPVIFPVHPRTSSSMKETGISYPSLYLVDPLGYLEFNYLVENAFAVITDSGGITEEASVMNVPCMTLRDNTERPETITLGTNELVGTNPDNLRPYLQKLMKGEWKSYQGIPLWDGNAAKRIVNKIIELYLTRRNH